MAKRKRWFITDGSTKNGEHFTVVGLYEDYQDALEGFTDKHPKAHMAPNSDLFTPFTARNYGVEYVLEEQDYNDKETGICL